MTGLRGRTGLGRDDGMSASCEHCKGSFEADKGQYRERFCSDKCAARHVKAKGLLQHMAPEYRQYVEHLLREHGERD
jgi:hypothetical protein